MGARVRPSASFTWLTKLSFASSASENLWGEYGSAGMFIEKKNRSSVPVQEAASDDSQHYSVNDITTYFTLLVGIYFPSVTGIGLTAAVKMLFQANPKVAT